MTDKQAPFAEGLEDAARREALRWYLEGNEEGAEDLLAAARAIAGPTKAPAPRARK